MVDPVPRLPSVRRLLDRNQYFAVHAPRQSGKTTTLLALCRDLCATGERVAVYVSCGSTAAAGDDFETAERQIVAAIQDAADEDLPLELLPPDPWPTGPPGTRLNLGLQHWAQHCPKPIVLFLDEIDALTGPSLVSVLQQLRDGYPSRPRAFPASVVLCGLRDVWDSGPTASPFNIKVESFRIRDFTEDQVRDLYAQHTAETGQEFTGEAVERAFYYTQGQPWLVNAIAAEIIDKMEISSEITAPHRRGQGTAYLRPRHTPGLTGRPPQRASGPKSHRAPYSRPSHPERHHLHRRCQLCPGPRTRPGRQSRHGRQPDLPGSHRPRPRRRGRAADHRQPPALPAAGRTARPAADSGGVHQLLAGER